MINRRRAFSFEDINALPLGFIESVEILKDGASATYGVSSNLIRSHVIEWAIAIPWHNHVLRSSCASETPYTISKMPGPRPACSARPNQRPRQRFHSLSFLEACASQHSRRAKNLRAFLGFEFGHAGLGGRTNQTNEGKEFHASTRRHKNWRGKIRFRETFAPWPLCVSL
jgi:hypothetical protein